MSAMWCEPSRRRHFLLADWQLEGHGERRHAAEAALGAQQAAQEPATLHPSGLLFSPFRTKCARSICVVARALPMPRGRVVGPGFGFRAGCTPDRPSFTWTVPGLSGSLVTHSSYCQKLLTQVSGGAFG